MRILFILLVAIAAFSCKKTAATSESNSSDTASLETQLMAIHDEAMPRLAEINKLSARLRDIRAGLKENEEGKIVPPDGLDKTLENLKLADQGMWDWMKSYSDTKETLKEDQLAAFYESEMVKVKAVKMAIDSSIHHAQTWLQVNGDPNAQ